MHYLKHLKKIAIFLLLAFITFLFWLDKREIKKEPFAPSKFDVENLERNKKILHNSKLYNSEYRKYLQQEIEKEKEAEAQDQERKYQEKETEAVNVKSKKKKGKGEKVKNQKSKKTKKVKEGDGKIKEKTKRARIKKEQENNKNDKYINKHKIKNKKRS